MHERRSGRIRIKKKHFPVSMFMYKSKAKAKGKVPKTREAREGKEERKDYMRIFSIHEGERGKQVEWIVEIKRERFSVGAMGRRKITQWGKRIGYRLPNALCFYFFIYSSFLLVTWGQVGFLSLLHSPHWQLCNFSLSIYYTLAQRILCSNDSPSLSLSLIFPNSSLPSRVRNFYLLAPIS